MRVQDRYNHLQDLFDMTAKDWAVLLNELEQLPLSERQTAIRGDYYESPL